jgi:NADH dehydrogenase
VGELHRLGAELVVGDVQDRGSLDAACRDVRAVVSAVASFRSQDPSNSMHTVERDGQIHLVDAAKASGVEHFIPSTYGLRPGVAVGDAPLVAAKAAAEQHLIRSGVPYTILYASFVMEAWLSPMLGFDAQNARARIYGSGQNPISWISYRNVAEIIVACVTDERFRNQTLELGGPEALSPLEVVRTFEQESGRTFELECVPAEALAAMGAGAEDPVQKTIAVFLQAYARGHVVDAGSIVGDLPLRWITVRDYARRVAGAAGAPSPGDAPRT